MFPRPDLWKVPLCLKLTGLNLTCLKLTCLKLTGLKPGSLNRNSLHWRLGLGLTVGLTLFWGISALGAGWVLRHEIDETLDEGLQETASRLLPLVIIDILDHDGDAILPDPRLLDPGPRRRRDEQDEDEHEKSGDDLDDDPTGAWLIWLVRDRTGQIVLRSPGADLSVFGDSPRTGLRQRGDWRLYGQAAMGGDIILEVAESLEHRKEATLESASTLLWPLLVLLPASWLGIWLFMRHSLAPVRSFRKALETRDASDLSPLSGAALPTELSPVAEAVNRLLQRLRQALEAERAFTANSSHELRTPIAASLAQAQRLVAESAGDPALQERAKQVEAALQRLVRLSEKVMQLARAEGGGVLAEEKQDLSLFIPYILEDIRREKDGKAEIRLVLPPETALQQDHPALPPLMSRMDPDAFGVLLRNLLENARKHGVPASGGSDISPGSDPVPAPVIRLDLRQAGMIRILNDCPPLAPDLLARIRNPWQRGNSPAEGSGLGLAIADRISRSAGWRLELYSPVQGEEAGFEARLLPEPT